MLVLSRRHGEVIRIGEHIKITIVRIQPSCVRIGIEAPREMNIVREELVEFAKAWAGYDSVHVEIEGEFSTDGTHQGRSEALAVAGMDAGK